MVLFTRRCTVIFYVTERELVTAAVASFHTKWRARVNDRELIIGAGGLSFLVVAGFASLAVIGKCVMAPTAVTLWQLLTLVGLLAIMNGFFYWRTRKWKKVLDDNNLHKWLQEIIEMDPTERDRRKFLTLISCWPDGHLLGALSLLEGSPLQQLSYVRELRKYIRMPKFRYF